MLDSLDIGSIVYPRYITAEKILAYIRAMQNSVGSNIETLYHIFDNRAEALEFKVEKDSPVIGKPIMELKLKDNLLLACLNRNGKVIIPRGQDVICGRLRGRCYNAHGLYRCQRYFEMAVREIFLETDYELLSCYLYIRLDHGNRSSISGSPWDRVCDLW